MDPVKVTGHDLMNMRMAGHARTAQQQVSRSASGLLRRPMADRSKCSQPANKSSNISESAVGSGHEAEEGLRLQEWQLQGPGMCAGERAPAVGTKEGALGWRTPVKVSPS